MKSQKEKKAEYDREYRKQNRDSINAKALLYSVKNRGVLRGESVETKGGEIMGGAIEFKNKKKGERFVKGLKKKQTAAKVDAEIGIPGAMKIIEKLEKRIKALEGVVAKLSGQYDLLWAWKMESEMKGE